MPDWLSSMLEYVLDFSNVLNASISASWLILVVVVLRLLLKKTPKWVAVMLWGIVAIRLLIPFSIESVFSLIPSAETISEELLQAGPVPGAKPAYLEIVTNPSYGREVTMELDQSIGSFQWDLLSMTFVWLAGVTIMAIYTAVSYWRLRKKVSTAVILRDNIFQSENVASPFVLGIIRPKVYLPYHMDGQDLNHVVAHEQAHIHRKDHWWKPLGFLLLTIHWFNPLMWLAYILLCRDIELACDEKVIKGLGNEQRADYTQALVACSVNRRMIAACPLAFGEVGVKERVKSVMNYKKPAFWVILLAVIVCVVVAVCFLTNPETEDTPASAEDSYFLLIGADGVETIEISGVNTSGGVVNADGSAFKNGEKVWLEPLQGVTDLRGVSITAIGADGEVLYVLSIPEGASNTEMINLVGSDGWLLAPNDFENDLTGIGGKTYLYENEGIMGSFTITLYDDGTFTYYEGMASSYIGVGSWEQDGDTITLTDDGHGGYGLVNHFKLDGDNLKFVEEDSANFVYVKVKDGEKFHCTGEAFKQNDGVDGSVQIMPNRKLSLDDVIRLSQKGHALTWRDFEDYAYIEAGSGLYIRVYEINEMYELWIGGAGPDSDPMYIYLSLADDLETRIDIRDGGVEEFIAADHSEVLLTNAIYDAILEHNKPSKPDGLYHCASFVLLDQQELCICSDPPTPMQVIVYGMALHQAFSFTDTGLYDAQGSHIPVVLTFEEEDGVYTLLEYWQPRDGSYYAQDIREKFPDEVEEDAMDTQKYIVSQVQNCYDQAVRNGGVDTDTVIEQLLEVIASSPAHSSNPGDYIEEHAIEYRELTYYGQYTLQYCFEQFLKGGQSDLIGHIMALTCQDIMLGWGEAYAMDQVLMTGQDWFEEFRSNAGSLAGQYSNEELAEQYPGAYILQQMGGIASITEYISGIPVLDDPNATVSKLSGKNIIVAHTIDNTTAYTDNTLNHTEFIIPKGKAVVVLQTLKAHSAEITYSGRTVWVDTRCLILG